MYSLQVNTNGIVVLRNGTVPVKQTLQTFLDVPFPIQNHTFIAPFYGDVDTRGLEPGVVWYSDTVTSDSETLQQAQRQIRDAFPVYGDFSPVYLIVATWDHVGYYEKRNDKVCCTSLHFHLGLDRFFPFSYACEICFIFSSII